MLEGFTYLTERPYRDAPKAAEAGPERPPGISLKQALEDPSFKAPSGSASRALGPAL